MKLDKRIEELISLEDHHTDFVKYVTLALHELSNIWDLSDDSSVDASGMRDLCHHSLEAIDSLESIQKEIRAAVRANKIYDSANTSLEGLAS